MFARFVAWDGIFGCKKATVDAAEGNVSTQKQPVDKRTDHDKATLKQSAIRAAQKIHVTRLCR